jgi:hypothetical protein
MLFKLGLIKKRERAQKRKEKKKKVGKELWVKRIINPTSNYSILYEYICIYIYIEKINSIKTVYLL